MPKRVNLSAYKAEKRDKDSIEIETDDGDVFVIDPPSLWPDSVAELAKNQDLQGIARALLGDARFDEFVAKGGSATIISKIVEEELGGTVPESSASPSS